MHVCDDDRHIYWRAPVILADRTAQHNNKKNVRRTTKINKKQWSKQSIKDG